MAKNKALVEASRIAYEKIHLPLRIRVRDLLIDLIKDGLCEDVQVGGSFSSDVAGDFEKKHNCKVDISWTAGVLTIEVNGEKFNFDISIKQIKER